jgi:hypothetical protein
MGRVGSLPSCTGDDRTTVTTTGGGEAHTGEEKDTGEVLMSPTFRFANSKGDNIGICWGQQLGFGEEDGTKVGERSGSSKQKEFFLLTQALEGWEKGVDQVSRRIFFIDPSA